MLAAIEKPKQQPAIQATEFSVTYNAGFGNFLSIRGQGASVLDQEGNWQDLNNWNTPVAMSWTNGNRWVAQVRVTSDSCEIKVKRNDKEWQKEANTKLVPNQGKMTLDKISF